VQNFCGGELFAAISRLGCGKSVTAQLRHDQICRRQT
jgi:hypothetical protein